MLNEEFYNHKAAVLMVQKSLQDSLADKGFETADKQIHELIPMIADIQAGGGDVNAELDTLNNELLTVNGKAIETSNAEPIEDINVELDVLNNELSEIKGE